VAGAVDDPHGAAAELLQDVVALHIRRLDAPAGAGRRPLRPARAGRRHPILEGRLGDDGGLAAQPRQLQRLPDHSAQVLVVERRDHIVVGPLLHRLDGVMRRGGLREEHDRDAGVDLPDASVDVEPREVGEAKVEQDHIRRPLADATDPLLAGAGHINPVWRGAEDMVHLRQDQVRAVHEQQLPHGAPRGASRLA
jgi:hypothetical protein